MTFWARSKILSPVLVRLLARRKNGGPLTDDEIVGSMSGLSLFEVQTLSRRIDWSGVAVDTMQLYLAACGCDFESRADMKRVDSYLATNPTFKYLQTDPQWKTRWMPMLIVWRQAYRAAPAHARHPGIHKLAERLTPLLKVYRV